MPDSTTLEDKTAAIDAATASPYDEGEILLGSFIYRDGPAQYRNFSNALVDYPELVRRLTEEFTHDPSSDSDDAEYFVPPSRMNSSNSEIRYPMTLDTIRTQIACAITARQKIIDLRQSHRSEMAKTLKLSFPEKAHSEEEIDQHLSHQDPTMSKAFKAFETRNSSELYADLSKVASTYPTQTESSTLSKIDIAYIQWAVNIVHRDLFDDIRGSDELSVLTVKLEEGEEALDEEDEKLSRCTCAELIEVSRLPKLEEEKEEEDRKV